MQLDLNLFSLLPYQKQKEEHTGIISQRGSAHRENNPKITSAVRKQQNQNRSPPT
jgi:hypothetical protein